MLLWLNVEMTAARRYRVPLDSLRVLRGIRESLSEDESSSRDGKIGEWVLEEDFLIAKGNRQEVSSVSEHGGILTDQKL